MVIENDCLKEYIVEQFNQILNYEHRSIKGSITKTQ